MRIFHNRPLAFACVMAALAAVFCSGSGKSPVRLALMLIFASVAVALGVYCAVRKKSGAISATAMLTCICAAALLFSSQLFYGEQVDRLQDYAGRETEAQGVVLRREDSGGYGSRFLLHVTELDGKRTDRTVYLDVAYPSALRPGEVVRLNAGVQGEGGADSFDLSGYYPDGVCGVLLLDRAEDCTVLPESAGGWDAVRVTLFRWNDALSERLAELIGGRAGGLAAALLLGNRSYLDPQEMLRFRRAGIAHLLAISGMHVGILVAFLDGLLRAFLIPKRIRVFPVSLFFLFYIGLTGASPPTVRAVFMMFGAYLALLLFRHNDPFTTLSLTLFLILLGSPYAVADNGLWLSFCAVGAIVIFRSVIQKKLARKRKSSRGMRRRIILAGKRTVTALYLGCVVFCALLPLSAGIFGSVSAASVPMTILLSPVLSVALVMLVICMILPFPFIASIAAKPLGILLRAADFVSDREGVLLLLQDRRTLILTGLTAFLVILFAVIPLRRKILLALPFCFAVLALISARYAVPSPESGTGLTYRREKSAEFYLLTSGSEAVAIDCSDGTVSYPYALWEELQVRGCTELEELVLTHYHSSATYLLNKVCRTIKLRTLRLPEPADEEEEAIARRIAQEAEYLGIPVVRGIGQTKLADEVALSRTRRGAESEIALAFSIGETRIVCLTTPAEAFSPEALQVLSDARIFILAWHGMPQSPSTRVAVPIPPSAETVLIAPDPEQLSIENGSPDAEILRGDTLWRTVLPNP